jgi:hypothetical protein
MTNGNRESRFEELRRKARERLEQVREGIEREKDTTSGMARPSPAPPEVVSSPVERELPPDIVSEPEPAYQEGDRGADAWKQRVVVPSHPGSTAVKEPAPAFDAPRIGPTIATTPSATTATRPLTKPKSAGRTHSSAAALLLERGALRQAIIAQEILGKPLSMRPPQDDE